MVVSVQFEKINVVDYYETKRRWPRRNRDTVLRLARRGALRGEELTAAIELERCILSIDCAPAAWRYDVNHLVRSGKHGGTTGEKGMVGQLDQRQSLKRWVDRLKAERGGWDALCVTIEVIMGEGLARIDKRYRRRRGWARRRLDEGLKIFRAVQQKT